MLTDVAYDTKFIAQLFDIQPDAVVWFVPIFTSESGDTIIDFEIQYCNSSTANLLKIPRETLLGSRVKSNTIFERNLGAAIFEQLRHVWTTGNPIETTFHNTTIDKHLNVQRTRILNGVLSIARDRTAEVRAEAAKKYQAIQLKSIMDASMNGIFACEAIRDDDGKIKDLKVVTINKAFTQILRRTEEETVGKLYTEIFPNVIGTDLVEIHANVIETGEPVQTERFYRDDKIEGWFLISISKWGDNGVVQSFHDCSHLKQLQQQLELTIQGLQRSNERLTEFTYVASHDLNEPLRKIATFSKLLTQRLGTDIEASARDYLERIERTTQRMQTLLDNLLTYSRISKQINRFEPVDLNMTVREVLSDLEVSIAQKNAVIHVDVLPTITGDRAQLRQLFQNLISNAIKFQESGNIPEVTIRNGGDKAAVSSSNKHYTLVEVKDNGVGFDQSESEKIFQLFHRLHARHEYEGTGIGLAVVQRAVENHHGFIEAKSEKGAGSTFKVFFPVQR